MNLKTDRQKRDEELDKLLDDNDEQFQKLLEKVENTKKIDSGFLKCEKRYKRTKQALQTLCEADLEDSREGAVR